MHEYLQVLTYIHVKGLCVTTVLFIIQKHIFVIGYR